MLPSLIIDGSGIGAVITLFKILFAVHFVITPSVWLGLKTKNVKPDTVMGKDNGFSVCTVPLQDVKHWYPVGHVQANQDIIKDNYLKTARRNNKKRRKIDYNSNGR